MPDLSNVRRPAWWPAWSEVAGLRTLRAVVIIPSLFAITYEGVGNLQMALFAAFGGFANLIFASFGGTRRDKAIAHLALAVIGSVALIIGTAVNSITWLAVLVTIPVAFGIFFAGVAGPNAASGVNATLLLFVLPVATPGTIAMIPDRLAGWWLASAVSTVAVVFVSAPAPGDRLRAAAANSGRTLAAHVLAAVHGTAKAGDMDTCRSAWPRPTRAWPAWCSCSSGAPRWSATRPKAALAWRVPLIPTATCSPWPPRCWPGPVTPWPGNRVRRTGPPCCARSRRFSRRA